MSCRPASVLRPSDDDMAGVGGVDDEVEKQCEPKEGEEVELSSEDEAGERRTKKLPTRGSPTMRPSTSTNSHTPPPQGTWRQRARRDAGRFSHLSFSTSSPDVAEVADKERTP